jgi:hypothetical protein
MSPLLRAMLSVLLLVLVAVGGACWTRQAVEVSAYMVGGPRGLAPCGLRSLAACQAYVAGMRQQCQEQGRYLTFWQAEGRWACRNTEQDWEATRLALIEGTPIPSEAELVRRFPGTRPWEKP